MTDEEFYDCQKTGLSFFTASLLLPSVVGVFALFGYSLPIVTAISFFLLFINAMSFVRRAWFLKRHKRFISKKQYNFQTISYLILVIFSIVFAFFVKQGQGESVFIQILRWGAIIYSFIILAFMHKTARSVYALVKTKYNELKSRED